MIHRANARKGEAPAVRMRNTDGFTEVNLKINPKAATRAPEQGVRGMAHGSSWAGHMPTDVSGNNASTSGGRRK